MLNGATAADVDEIQASLGALVDVLDVESPIARQNRNDDGQPHWCGAGVGDLEPGNQCTSGFALDTKSAGKAMTIASHCFRNDQRIESGDEPYGEGRKRSDYPLYDVMLVNGENQNYDDDLYHNPYTAEHDPIDVDGKRDADRGDVVCVSGWSSLASCGLDVVGLSAELCDVDGCTPGLFSIQSRGRGVRWR